MPFRLSPYSFGYRPRYAANPDDGQAAVQRNAEDLRQIGAANLARHEALVGEMRARRQRDEDLQIEAQRMAEAFDRQRLLMQDKYGYDAALTDQQQAGRMDLAGMEAANRRAMQEREIGATEDRDFRLADISAQQAEDQFGHQRTLQDDRLNWQSGQSELDQQRALERMGVQHGQQMEMAGFQGDIQSSRDAQLAGQHAAQSVLDFELNRNLQGDQRGFAASQAELAHQRELERMGTQHGFNVDMRGLDFQHQTARDEAGFINQRMRDEAGYGQQERMLGLTAGAQRDELGVRHGYDLERDTRHALASDLSSGRRYLDKEQRRKIADLDRAVQFMSNAKGIPSDKRETELERFRAERQAIIESAHWALPDEIPMTAEEAVRQRRAVVDGREFLWNPSTGTVTPVEDRRQAEQVQMRSRESSTKELNRLFAQEIGRKREREDDGALIPYWSRSDGTLDREAAWGAALSQHRRSVEFSDPSVLERNMAYEDFLDQMFGGVKTETLQEQAKNSRFYQKSDVVHLKNELARRASQDGRVPGGAPGMLPTASQVASASDTLPAANDGASDTLSGRGASGGPSGASAVAQPTIAGRPRLLTREEYGAKYPNPPVPYESYKRQYESGAADKEKEAARALLLEVRKNPAILKDRKKAEEARQAFERLRQ